MLLYMEDVCLYKVIRRLIISHGGSRNWAIYYSRSYFTALVENRRCPGVLRRYKGIDRVRCCSTGPLHTVFPGLRRCGHANRPQSNV